MNVVSNFLAKDSVLTSGCFRVRRINHASRAHMVSGDGLVGPMMRLCHDFENVQRCRVVDSKTSESLAGYFGLLPVETSAVRARTAFLGWNRLG